MHLVTSAPNLCHARLHHKKIGEVLRRRWEGERAGDAAPWVVESAPPPSETPGVVSSQGEEWSGLWRNRNVPLKVPPPEVRLRSRMGRVECREGMEEPPCLSVCLSVGCRCCECNSMTFDFGSRIHLCKCVGLDLNLELKNRVIAEIEAPQMGHGMLRMCSPQAYGTESRVGWWTCFWYMVGDSWGHKTGLGWRPSLLCVPKVGTGGRRARMTKTMGRNGDRILCLNSAPEHAMDFF